MSAASVIEEIRTKAETARRILLSAHATDGKLPMARREQARLELASTADLMRAADQLAKTKSDKAALKAVRFESYILATILKNTRVDSTLGEELPLPRKPDILTGAMAKTHEFITRAQTLLSDGELDQAREMLSKAHLLNSRIAKASVPQFLKQTENAERLIERTEATAKLYDANLSIRNANEAVEKGKWEDANQAAMRSIMSAAEALKTLRTLPTDLTAQTLPAAETFHRSMLAARSKLLLSESQHRLAQGESLFQDHDYAHSAMKLVDALRTGLESYRTSGGVSAEARTYLDQELWKTIGRTATDLVNVSQWSLVEGKKRLYIPEERYNALSLLATASAAARTLSKLTTAAFPHLSDPRQAPTTFLERSVQAYVPGLLTRASEVSQEADALLTGERAQGRGVPFMDPKHEDPVPVEILNTALERSKELMAQAVSAVDRARHARGDERDTLLEEARSYLSQLMMVGKGVAQLIQKLGRGQTQERYGIPIVELARHAKELLRKIEELE